MGRVFRVLLLCAIVFQTSDSELHSAKLTLLNVDANKHASFIVKALYHEPVTGTAVSGLSETEKPMGGDNWYWTDDNAKSLEALSIAPVFPKFLHQSAEIVKFIIANSPPPFVFRRRTNERFEVVSDNPEDFRIATGLMNFHGNLRQADVRQGYRFHDDRNEDALKFTADSLRFSTNGAEYSVDLKSAIADVDVHREAKSVRLTHRSPLKAGAKTVGTVSYSYKIESDKPYLTLEISLTAAPGAVLRNVDVSASLDQLDSLSNVRFSRFYKYSSGTPEFIAAAQSSSARTLSEGPASWWALIQSGDHGNAYAAATLLANSAQLRKITATEEHEGHYRHVSETYGADVVTEASPLTIVEKKVLLAGGLYNNIHAYDRIFSQLDGFPGLDLSISYDIGAELNGVAAAYLADKRRLAVDRAATPLIYTNETRRWLDETLDSYMSNFVVKVGHHYPYIFSRGEAFVLLAVDLMHAATGDPKYIDVARRLADVLLTFQSRKGKSAGGFRCTGGDVCMDCHAAALVALSRAAILLNERRYALAVKRGFELYSLDSAAATGEDIFVWMVPEGNHRDSYYLIYKAGLLLRSLEGVGLLAERGLLRLTRDEWAHVQKLRSSATNYIAQTVHARGELQELLTSYKSGETNSETQAWALLGLYPIEHEYLSEHEALKGRER